MDICGIAEERLIDKALLETAIQKKIDDAIKASNSSGSNPNSDNCIKKVKSIDLLSVDVNLNRFYRLITAAGSICNFNTNSKYELANINLINVKDDVEVVDCVLKTILKILNQKLEMSDLAKAKQDLLEIEAKVKEAIQKAAEARTLSQTQIQALIDGGREEGKVWIYNARQYAEADLIVKQQTYNPTTGAVTIADTTDKSAKYWAKAAKGDIGQRGLKTEIVVKSLAAGSKDIVTPFYKNDILVFADGIFQSRSTYGEVTDTNDSKKATGFTFNNPFKKEVSITVVKLGGNMVLDKDYATVNDVLQGLVKTKVISPFALAGSGLLTTGKAFKTANYYKVGDIISYGGTIYSCNTDHHGAFDNSHFDVVKGINPIVRSNKPYLATDIASKDILIDTASGYPSFKKGNGDLVELVPAKEIIKVQNTAAVLSDFNGTKQLIWDDNKGVLYGLNASNDVIALSGEISITTSTPSAGDFATTKFVYDKQSNILYGKDDTDTVVPLNQSIQVVSGTPTAGAFGKGLVLTNEDGLLFTKKPDGTVQTFKPVAPILAVGSTPTASDFGDTDILVASNGDIYTKASDSSIHKYSEFEIGSY